MTYIKTLATAFFCLFISAHAASGETGRAQTLLQLAGVKTTAAPLSESVLLIIDAQREYLDGHLPLDGMAASVEEAGRVLQRARRAGVPVIHIVHHGKPGGTLFDPEGPWIDIIDPLKPLPGETRIVKSQPDAFVGTELSAVLEALGRKNLVVIGYMTHMCVSATVRDASSRGYHSTIVAKATATRDLPAADGGTLPAAHIQAASLAALGDRFAVIVPTAEALND